jgi:hypothetical protein
VTLALLVLRGLATSPTVAGRLSPLQLPLQLPLPGPGAPVRWAEESREELVDGCFSRCLGGRYVVGEGDDESHLVADGEQDVRERFDELSGFLTGVRSDAASSACRRDGVVYFEWGFGKLPT